MCISPSAVKSLISAGTRTLNTAVVNKCSGGGNRPPVLWYTSSSRRTTSAPQLVISLYLCVATSIAIAFVSVNRLLLEVTTMCKLVSSCAKVLHGDPFRSFLVVVCLPTSHPDSHNQ